MKTQKLPDRNWYRPNLVYKYVLWWTLEVIRFLRHLGLLFEGLLFDLESYFEFLG